MNKNEIKKKIDKLSNNLIPLYGRGVGSTGAVLTIYIGKDSEMLMKELLNEAFSTSFTTNPYILEMSLESLEIEEKEFQERLTTVIREASDLSNLRLVFITLMDDPVFTDSSCAFVGNIDRTFQKLRKMGIALQNVALYGLFRAEKVLDHDYKNAFDFVREGKGIWKNIFHAEVPINAESLKAYADLIAVHCIAHQYDMSQNADRNEYAWQSIYLHCLKVPEFLITRVLHRIYASQITRGKIERDELDKRINNTLNEAFSRIFGDELSGCEQFIPLNYQADLPVQSRGGFWPFGNRPKTVPVYSLADIAKEKGALASLASLAFEDKILEKNEYDRIIESIITNSNMVNEDLSTISEAIDQVLKTIEDNYRERKAITLNRYYTEEKADIDEVLSFSFSKEKERAIFDKKIEMISELRKRLKSNETIGRVVKDIVKRNDELLDILEDLSINTYGGTLGELKLKEIPKFKVNLSIEEVLAKLSQNWLAGVIKDKDLVMQQLNAFLAREIARLNNKHCLGEIGPEFTQLEPISTVMLMPPALGADKEYQKVVEEAGCLYIRKDAIFRESTFYMLSSRKYSSEKYIRRYSGEEE